MEKAKNFKVCLKLSPHYFISMKFQLSIYGNKKKIVRNRTLDSSLKSFMILRPRGKFIHNDNKSHSFFYKIYFYLYLFIYFFRGDRVHKKGVCPDPWNPLWICPCVWLYKVHFNRLQWYFVPCFSFQHYT